MGKEKYRNAPRSQGSVTHISKNQAFHEMEEMRKARGLETQRHQSLLMLLTALINRHGYQEFTRDELECSDPSSLVIDVRPSKIKAYTRGQEVPEEEPKVLLHAVSNDEDDSSEAVGERGDEEVTPFPPESSPEEPENVD